jgi:uncharacterized protein YbjT (DUF2867 family)
MSKKILVSGATGQQGGAVVKALLKDGHQVVGITRNVESPKAKALAEQGVEMVSVDFTDKDALVEIMKNVDTVFSMTTPFQDGLDKEIEQGKSMATAASEAGVGHFIFNSVADADRATGIPHFDSKYEVEKHIAALKLNYTIVGPTYFMDNMMFFNMDGLKEGVLRVAMPADRKLQQIAVEDIGKFVGVVVNERENMFGKRINIAGDDLSGEEAAAILSKVTGREIRYEGFSPEMVKEHSEDMAIMYDWFNKDGYTANLEDLQQYGLMNFEDWASKQDWTALKEVEENTIN